MSLPELLYVVFYLGAALSFLGCLFRALVGRGEYLLLWFILAGPLVVVALTRQPMSFAEAPAALSRAGFLALLTLGAALTAAALGALAAWLASRRLDSGASRRSRGEPPPAPEPGPPPASSSALSEGE